jgi:hypothetical protein
MKVALQLHGVSEKLRLLTGFFGFWAEERESELLHSEGSSITFH